MSINEIRIPYEKRDSLQEKKHREYGKLFMTNIDNISDLFIEIADDGERSLAYVEFKNDHEIIKPFMLKAIKNDCDQLGRPFYISVIYRDPIICYYLIPMNDAAKALPHMEDAHFWTEQQYIWLLHKLRNKPVNKEILKQFCGKLPDPLPPLPNIQK